MPIDKTTVKGTWWQEHQPDTRLQGEITYGPLSGAEVDLFGHFDNPLDFSRPTNRFTLHGLTYKNKPITLFDCLVSGSQVHIPGQASSKVSTVSGIVGGHYHSPEDIRFKQVSAPFTNLKEWVWTTGLTMAPASDPESITATYRLPSLIPLGQFGPLQVNIEFSVNAHPDFHSLTIEQDCALLIQADSLQPYALFEECLSSFQRFLTLALQRSAYSTGITARIDQPRETVANIPLYEDYIIIRSRSSAESDRPTLIPQDILFTSHELDATPAQAFTRFVDRQKILAASMDLYFSTIHHDFSLPRVRFLTLAQSLEAYHRATMPGCYISEDSYHSGLRKLLWEAIPKSDHTVSKDFLASLNAKLDHLHEYSLRKRLKALAAKHSPVLERLIGTPEEFSSAVADRRNQLTHPGGHDPSQDYRALWVLSEKMSLLLEVCFLDEIGFSRERQKQIVTSRSRRARRVHQGWV